MSTLIENLEWLKYIDCDTIIYILIGSFAFSLCLLYIFRWRDYLLPYWQVKHHPLDFGTAQFPKLSVIIPACEQGENLMTLIPTLFQQDYPDFEVIVIDEASTDNTTQILELLQLRYPNLRTSFIPPSAKDICYRKMAISLGIRAARSEWVVITSATASPASRQWLKALAGCIEPHTEIIIGYSNFASDDTDSCRKAIYERYLRQLRNYRATSGFGAIGAEEVNFAIRKETFIAHRGYAQLLDSPFGESHLLVDSIATPLNVNFTCHPEAVVFEQFMLPELWERNRIEYREVLRRSSSRAHYYLRREGLASLLLYFELVLLCCYIGTRVYQYVQPSLPSLWWITADISMLLLVVIAGFLPLLLLRKSSQALGITPIGIELWKWRFVQPWSNFLLKVKRKGLLKKRA